MKYYIGVCFFPEKQRLFRDIVQDSDNSGIEIKRFRTSDNGNDIIFNDFTSWWKETLQAKYYYNWTSD